MPEQHQGFFAMLSFVVLGAVDPEGQVWATLRAGRPGFMAAVDARHLRLGLARDPADPEDAGMEDGDALGLLGIDPVTRRRNRLNGTLRRSGADAFTVAVVQSFGNCPQYIQQRAALPLRDPRSAASAPPVVSERLDGRARAIISGADTFYVATYADIAGGERQVDVSHRGGRPGFVRIDADGRLTVPDFAGNRFFNTLGNMLVNPKAGLTFVEDGTGDLLQMTGRAEVLPDSPEVADFAGAERLWRFEPQKLVFRPAAFPLALSLVANGWSPSTLRTGVWEQGRGEGPLEAMPSP
ncbi:pyridoxamine 5'-phosphate oxidase family protein [Pararoseomonas indoligenes]|uniref:Pyridoxamine 5'-phosphate oxidase family protein n=1 Tax=Roseomonas indoligenes TaxID=2820811 RepID=A0A940S552_9PROT|nr:pyridoxamine 5'-phosphate oxidase family protein [Pararoseomonas indoligenes]MBP0492659.1 pyridoxamine 5'-phosphate oxidase family protein [Pararoseomonas indoligenes]